MLNFGIIGCGRIGQRHAEQMGSFGNLLAVCDIDTDKAHAFSKKHNAHAYTEIDELLIREKSIDLIAVCTPNFLHAGILSVGIIDKIYRAAYETIH